jgi:hypothetical protein
LDARRYLREGFTTLHDFDNNNKTQIAERLGAMVKSEVAVDGSHLAAEEAFMKHLFKGDHPSTHGKMTGSIRNAMGILCHSFAGISTAFHIKRAMSEGPCIESGNHGDLYLAWPRKSRPIALISLEGITPVDGLWYDTNC